MKTGILISAAVSIIFLTAFNGCLGVDHNFVSVRNDLIKASGRDYHRDVEFSLGSFELGILQKVVKSDDNNRDGEEIIKHISEVQIGVYKNRSAAPFNNKFKTINNIDRKMSENGWTFLVKSYRGNKLELVYLKKNDSHGLAAIFVVNLNPGKLEMVEVHGRLEKIAAYIIRDKGLSTQFANTSY